MHRLEVAMRSLRTYCWGASAIVTVGQDLIQSNCERPNVRRKRKLLLLQALNGVPIECKKHQVEMEN